MKLEPDLDWRPIHSEGFIGNIGGVDFAIRSATETRARFSVTAFHANSNGVCHGGALMAVADVSMGASAFNLGGSRPCATIGFDCAFLAPARIGDTVAGFVTIERISRDVCFARAAFYAEDRKAMTASGIWKYLNRKPTEAD